jgi:hypothetical protein
MIAVVRAVLVALTVGVFAGHASAQSADRITADRPGLADSANVVGKGAIQLETGGQWETRPGETAFFMPTLFRAGLSDRLEARIEGNTISTMAVEGARRTGLAPTSLGAKFALVLAEPARPGVSVIARVFPASGTNGFETRHLTGDLRLAVDWDMAEHFSLNPNAGFSFSDGEAETFATGVFAVTLAYSRHPGLSWFVDTSLQQREIAEGTASIIVDGGVAYIPRQNWQFDFSAGARARGDTPARMFIAVGLAFRTNR